MRVVRAAVPIGAASPASIRACLSEGAGRADGGLHPARTPLGALVSAPCAELHRGADGEGRTGRAGRADAAGGRRFTASPGRVVGRFQPERAYRLALPSPSAAWTFRPGKAKAETPPRPVVRVVGVVKRQRSPPCRRSGRLSTPSMLSTGLPPAPPGASRRRPDGPYSPLGSLGPLGRRIKSLRATG